MLAALHANEISIADEHAPAKLNYAMHQYLPRAGVLSRVKINARVSPLPRNRLAYLFIALRGGGAFSCMHNARPVFPRSLNRRNPPPIIPHARGDKWKSLLSSLEANSFRTRFLPSRFRPLSSWKVFDDYRASSRQMWGTTIVVRNAFVYRNNNIYFGN